MLAVLLLAAPGAAFAQAESPMPLRYWIDGGLAIDYTHGPAGDPYGFWEKDARNNPTGIATGFGIEGDMPVYRLARFFYGNPLAMRLGIGVEYYPFAAASRVVNYWLIYNGTPTRETGAGNKILLTGAWSMVRRFGSGSSRTRPFLEVGLGYAYMHGGPYEDRNAVTGETLDRVHESIGGGYFGEFGGGVRIRRGSRDLVLTVRTQGYTDFTTGGNSVQLLVGTVTH